MAQIKTVVDGRSISQRFDIQGFRFDVHIMRLTKRYKRQEILNRRFNQRI